MENLKNLGKALNKAQQKEIFGGFGRRPVGISDGDCNQAQQNSISCNPYGNSSECEMDAVCQGTHPEEIPGYGDAYLGGRCSCVN